MRVALQKGCVYTLLKARLGGPTWKRSRITTYESGAPPAVATPRVVMYVHTDLDTIHGPSDTKEKKLGRRPVVVSSAHTGMSSALSAHPQTLPQSFNAVFTSDSPSRRKKDRTAAFPSYDEAGDGLLSPSQDGFGTAIPGYLDEGAAADQAAQDDFGGDRERVGEHKRIAADKPPPLQRSSSTQRTLKPSANKYEQVPGLASEAVVVKSPPALRVAAASPDEDDDEGPAAATVTLECWCAVGHSRRALG